MKIYFGPAVGRSYEPDFISCVLKLLKLQPITFRPQCNDALVSRSRSIVGSQFLKSGCDVLLTIDTDIVFKAEDAIRLCEEAHARQQIMVGLYSTRGTGKNKKPASMLKRGQRIESGSSTPVEIWLGATGFMAVPREVFLAIGKDLPVCHQEMPWSFQPFYMPFVGEDDAGRPIYLSEDYAFCERAKSKGYGVYAIPDIHLLHVGPYAYELADGPYALERMDVPEVIYRLETPELVAAGA